MRNEPAYSLRFDGLELVVPGAQGGDCVGMLDWISIRRAAREHNDIGQPFSTRLLMSEYAASMRLCRAELFVGASGRSFT